MFCHSCGTENPDGAKFCRSCGNRFDVSAVHPEPQNQVIPPADETQPATFIVQPANSVQNSPSCQRSVSYLKGDDINDSQYVASPVSSGWADVIHSEGWFVRTLLLALCSLVPVLRWVVKGFAVRWGREVCLGINRRMPKSFLNKETFVTGAKLWVLDLVLDIVMFAVGILLYVIPVVGPVLSIIALLILSFVPPLLDFQVGLSGKISEGFVGIGRACKLLFKKPLKTLATTIGPSFVFNAVIHSFVCLFVTIFVLVSFEELPSTAISLINRTFNMLFTTGTIFVILGIVSIASLFAGAFACVWSNRALGHLVSREATEWLEIPDFLDKTNVSTTKTPKPFVPFS